MGPEVMLYWIGKAIWICLPIIAALFVFATPRVWQKAMDLGGGAGPAIICYTVAVFFLCMCALHSIANPEPGAVTLRQAGGVGIMFGAFIYAIYFYWPEEDE